MVKKLLFLRSFLKKKNRQSEKRRFTDFECLIKDIISEFLFKAKKVRE